jgi:hypothetical protein
MAQHYGHDPQQLIGATIGVQLQLAWTGALDHEVTLNVTIQRERRGPGFTARANVSRAFGSGDTVTELREAAKRKGVGPITLARMWILDHLHAHPRDQ